MPRKFKLAVLNSHPIQYFAPLYRRIAATDDIDLTVYFCSRQGLSSGYVDPGFGKEIVWDIPLLEGYRHKFLGTLRADAGPKGFFSLINPSIVAELRRERFDAIIVHGHNFATNVLAIAAAKVVGTAVFMRGETHLFLRRSRVKRLLRRPLMTLLYGMCDACLYIGTWNRQFYEHHGVAPGKLFLVPYTVDNDFFAGQADMSRDAAAELRREFGVDEQAALVLYASKLIPRKRPKDLLEAFAGVLSRGVKVELMFVGDGPELATLQATARDRHMKGIHFAGFRNQTELPRFYAAADMFVLPSEDEPWGLIINEVMCAAVPVITTSVVGASPDLVIDGKTGFVYPPGDIGRLSSAIETLARDPQLAKAMGREARARMAGWTYEECVRGIRSALERTA
jgi:glycosyltransferase involved in cell wall biosynthesis